MKVKRKKHTVVWIVLLSLFIVLAATFLVFTHFGGFGTGESADPEELSAYAGTVEDITIPENAQIIALGEATHGNVEFQKLKLEVFQLLVERYGVRAFALEGDYGGCEQVNRYIHGGSGTAEDAAAAIGFQIYRTKEMAELISYMRQYNENAAEGEDLRFYGFDMQRIPYTFQLLTEACENLGMDTSKLKELVSGEDWNSSYDTVTRKEILTDVKTQLEEKENAEQAVHCADMLLQYCELQNAMDNAQADDGGTQRDRFMAENVKWIAEQERKAGHDRIFVAGHNMHVARWGSYDSMGKLLADELGDAYYAIGTDFYKTKCNVPSSGGRTTQVFYSHDPLAKAAKTAGLDICWLDFGKIPKDSALGKLVSDYLYMGNLGESYSFIMRLLPPSYRMFQPPAQLYDGMIYVAQATPTTIINEGK